MDDFQMATQEWKQILGQRYVIQVDFTLRQAELATYPTLQRIPAILRPGSTEELSQCLKVANIRRVPVYPFSGGKNWGYGCKVPYSGQCSLIDLSRLNRILDYNEKLAFVVVEPGVTQKQLHDFLIEQGGRHWIDPTSSSPDASVIGNIVERGHGLTPYCDHAVFACDYEVVLPDGQILRANGLTENQSQTARIDPRGPGPLVQGLFSQSNLGIVTKMTVWLMPAPERTCMAYVPLASDDELSSAIDAIRPLRLDGTLRAGPFFVNFYRCLQITTTYPWERAAGKTPLAPELAGQIAKEAGIATWNAFFSMYGTHEQVEAHLLRVRKALKDMAPGPRFPDLRFYDEPDLHPSSTSSPIERYIRFTYRRMTGRLEGNLIRQPYWRLRMNPTPDRQPEEDGAGVIFCPTSLPFTGDHATRAVSRSFELILQHGFEPSMSLVGIQERALHCYISIIYDRAVRGDDDRAMACQKALINELFSMGYPPVRLGIHSVGAWELLDPGFREFVEKIKRAIDPNRTLAPGKPF